MSAFGYFCLAITILARGGGNLFAYPATWIVIASIAALIFAFCMGRKSRDEEVRFEKDSCERNIRLIREDAKNKIAIEADRWKTLKNQLLGENMQFSSIDERIERLMAKEDEIVRRAMLKRAPKAAEQVYQANQEARRLYRECMRLKTKVEVYESIDPSLKNT